MSEHSANALQTLLPNGAVLFTETPVPCNKGLVFHREGSGIFRLASPSKILGKMYGGCCCNRKLLESMYQVGFHCNVSVPTGGTAEAISLAIAIDGTPDQSSAMIFTPTAVNVFGNVGAEIIVAVPAICGCESVSVINTSSQAVEVQNANIIFSYLGTKV